MNFKNHKKIFFVVGILISLFFSFSTISYAHKLSVFAWVEGDVVFVEGRLSSGKMPKTGEIYVYDGENNLIKKLDVNPDGLTSFPLPDYSTGLKIDMKAGEGHQNYWILTPYDIEAQQKEANKQD